MKKEDYIGIAVLALVWVALIAILRTFNIDLNAEMANCLEQGGSWSTGDVGGYPSHWCVIPQH